MVRIARRRGGGPCGIYLLACFWRRVRESAIMAMNSEFVGFPLMFETVLIPLSLLDFARSWKYKALDL